MVAIRKLKDKEEEEASLGTSKGYRTEENKEEKDADKSPKGSYKMKDKQEHKMSSDGDKKVGKCKYCGK